MNDSIQLHIEDGIARITLSRPSRLNAFNADLAHGWSAVTEEATTSDDVQAILIDAQGPAFCAGGDVVEMSDTADGAALEELATVINAGIRALVSSAVPVVAAAHGTTAGGGLGILLSSDYAVVGSDSRIGSLYANIGLTPDLSVSAQLARAVGQRRALQLVLQDRLLTAQEAQEWGLVAEVVDGSGPEGIAEAVRERGMQIARFWRDGAAHAYGEAKRLVRAQPERAFADQLADEARSIGRAFGTPEAQARIAAFARRSAGTR